MPLLRSEESDGVVHVVRPLDGVEECEIFRGVRQEAAPELQLLQIMRRHFLLCQWDWLLACNTNIPPYSASKKQSTKKAKFVQDSKDGSRTSDYQLCVQLTAVQARLATTWVGVRQMCNVVCCRTHRRSSRRACAGSRPGASRWPPGCDAPRYATPCSPGSPP